MPVGVAVLEGGCGGTLLKVQSLIIIKYTPVLALSKVNKVAFMAMVCHQSSSSVYVWQSFLCWPTETEDNSACKDL